MDYAYRMYNSMYQNVKFYYEQINPATLSGAIDVIVVEQPDGDLLSTPFHVRFGKYGVFNYKEKYVDILINGKEVKNLRMKLSESGIAFFVEETEEHVPDYMVTSPVPDDQRPTTDKVLAETSRTLERHLLDGKDSSPFAGSPSAVSQPLSTGRTPPASHQAASPTSPGAWMRRSKSMVRGKEVERLRDKSADAAARSPERQRKLTLAYSSSVFSARKMRSLPNLALADTPLAEPGERKETLGTPVMNTSNGQKTPTRRVPRLRNTKSQGVNRERRRSSSSDSRTPSKRESKEKKEKSSPIDIRVVDHDSDGQSSSASSSTLSSPSLASLGPAEQARLAEGALSDSEVDPRNQTPPEQVGNEVAEWNWGQFPKTRDEQKKETEPAKPQRSYWSNWWWRSTEKGKTSPVPEEKQDGGVYLDDLLATSPETDPSKIEKYLGKAGGGGAGQSADADSGNGSQQHTSPSSPSTLSMPEEDKTPTQENVASVLNGVKKEKKREEKKEKERLPSEIFPMSEDEDVTQEEEESGLLTPHEKTYIRSLRLNSDLLKGLGLQWGANECRFSITTKFQGTSWCACNIYLYKYTDKLVISDIDGTITKSDVLGHIIPAIGGQWAHVGVAELYTRIKQNGYKLVYLSSRAIGQSTMTKNYLKKVQQDSRVLPDGPVLLAPDSVLVALRREVIERRPEEFKIAALSDLKKLFPGQSPFFAGFGNRETDTKSYRAVGVDSSRILIIDPSGIVRRSDSVGYRSSYKCMAQDSVDCIFPPILDERVQSGPHLSGLAFSQPQSASAYTFWADADHDEKLADDEIAKYEKTRSTGRSKRRK